MNWETDPRAQTPDKLGLDPAALDILEVELIGRALAIREDNFMTELLDPDVPGRWYLLTAGGQPVVYRPAETITTEEVNGNGTVCASIKRDLPPRWEPTGQGPLQLRYWMDIPNG